MFAATASAPARDLEVAIPAAPREGEAIVAAARWAADAINAAGGVAGRRLVVTFVPDPCVSGAGRAVAERVVQSAAVAVIGHACAPSALAAHPIYSGAGKPFIAAGAWLSGSRRAPLPFRVPAGTPSIGHALGRVLAAEAASVPGARIALLRDRTRASIQIAQEAAPSLAGALSVETFTGGDKDFAGLAARLKALGVTHVLLAGFASEAGLVVTDLVKAIPEVAIFAADALAGADFAAAAGKAADNVRVVLQTDAATLVGANARARALGEALIAGGHTPSRAALHTAAAVEAFAAAAQQALTPDGAINAAAWSSALTARPVTDSVLGDFGFNSDRAASVAVWTLYRWESGRLNPMYPVP